MLKLIGFSVFCCLTIYGQVIHINTARTWSDAEADCNNRGSNLLTAQGNTADINECIDLSSSGSSWIGLSRDSSNNWDWTSLSAPDYDETQVNWRGNNGPKSNRLSSDCAMLLTGGSNQGQISNSISAGCSTTRQYCCNPSQSNPNPEETPSPNTPSPITTPSDCPRIRKEWNTATTAERNLYINGMLELASLGRLRVFTQQHGELAAEAQAHGTSGFLPWHRLFLFELETQIRNLGDEYACFALLYWNWGRDVDLYGTDFDSYSVLNNGLGGRGDPSDNYCVTDGLYAYNAAGGYRPFYCPQSWESNTGQCCLARVTSTSSSTSLYSSMQNYNAIVASNLYGSDIDDVDVGIKDELEYGPHGTAHCTIGGCGGGHLGNGFYSPDDPVFYLLHAQVDYMWSLWQDYHNYDLVKKESVTDQVYLGNSGLNSDVDDVMEFDTLAATSWSTLSGTDRIRDVHDIADTTLLGYKYEYGSFIDRVNFPTTRLTSNWFVDDGRRRRRRLNENNDESTEYFDQIASKQLMAKYGEARVNTYKGRREMVSTLAKMSCEYVNSGGDECERPAYFDDCSDMERGVNIYNNHNDINITLEELIEKVSDYPCMVETRKLMYNFVAQLGGLWRLCRGDFDRFCDREFLRKRPRKNQCEAKGYSRDRNTKNKRAGSIIYGHVNEPQQYEQDMNSYHDTINWKDMFMNSIFNGVVIAIILFMALFIWMCCKRICGDSRKIGYNKVRKYVYENDQENDI